MNTSLSVLLTGVVDYAGLFPPAKLDMLVAVRTYHEYLRDPSRFMLGRFVVPVARLPEFVEHAASLWPSGSNGATPPWRVSALVGADVQADIGLVEHFNARHTGQAIIDVVEIKVSTTPEIASAMSFVPRTVQGFFEVPVSPDPEPLIAELRRSGGRAKIRTGGVTAEAFPLVGDVARFILRCHEHRVPFKATAGLHHPLRAEYRLTYDEHPPMGMMYGYLNVFLAAVYAHIGVDASWLEQVLLETKPKAFLFTDAGVTYRGRTVTTDTIREVRRTFAIAFGSCSFREPVDDLVPLGWAPAPSLAAQP